MVVVVAEHVAFVDKAACEGLDAEGSDVGKVTSGGFAPTLGQPIAMAYVPLAMAEPGTRIQLTQRGKVHEATVAAMPFVPHRYVR